MLNKEEIKKGLIDLGVKPGMILEVHSSLSSFGYVNGGADTVIRALKESITESGSLFMPALRLSPELDLSESDKKIGITVKIRILPPDCEHSAMGLIADTFRRMPDTFTGNGVFRVCGWGNHGEEAVKNGLQYALEHDGYALLFGVDIYKLTAMHYVECLMPKEIQNIFAPNEAAQAIYPADEWLIETGCPPVKAWYTIQQKAYDKGLIRDGMIGNCRVMFFRIQDVVEIYSDALKQDPYGLYGLN